jgi:cytochrome P450
MDKVLWALFDLIKQKYNSKGSILKPMDFAQIIQYFTLDVITSLALGHPFGYITDGDDVDKYDYVRTQEENFPAMNFISAVPALARILTIPSVQRKAIPTVKDRVGMGKVKAVTAELVSRRFGDKKEVRQDMTQSFISHGLTQGEIADESLLQILAGSDTSATILRAMFISLIGSPQAYTRLQDACIAAEVPLSEIITNAQALEIPYLVACVREGLRHHPAATGLLPRVTGPLGEHHPGMPYIPPNTEVGICAWNMHRHNTAVYGEDAGMFRPERWLENSSEKLRDMEKAQDLVFGFGRYRCMGERIAKVELHKTLFELFRRFDWAFVDSMKPLEKNMNYGLFQQKGMWVRVSERVR